MPEHRVRVRVRVRVGVRVRVTKPGGTYRSTGGRARSTVRQAGAPCPRYGYCARPRPAPAGGRVPQSCRLARE